MGTDEKKKQNKKMKRKSNEVEKNGGEGEFRLINDDRFAVSQSDPRFMDVTMKRSKAEIDSLFSHLFSDPRLASSTTHVDKRSKRRNRNQVGGSLKHYYRLENEEYSKRPPVVEDEGGSEGESDEVGIATGSVEKLNGSSEDVDDGGQNSDGSSASRSTDSDGQYTDLEKEDALMQPDESITKIDKETHRLAVVNMDWSQVPDEIMDFMQKKEDAKMDQLLMSPSSSSRMTNFESSYFGEGEKEWKEDASLFSKKRTSSRSFQLKRPRTKGPMDVYFNPDPTKVIEAGKLSKGKQQVIGEIHKKDLRDQVCSSYAKWFYDAGIPFNAVNYDSFKIAVELTGQFGPGMKPPSYHELRGPLLKKELDDVMCIVESHRAGWNVYGCSIIFDGWRDSVSHREIVNLLVNSPKGSVFIKSRDVSEIVNDANALLIMFEEMVDYVGEHNVIQIVTDNTSNYKKAGQMLQLKKPNLFWSPCAAHCIDLILEDIGKIPIVRGVIKNSVSLTSFIYNRIGVLNLMRRYTGKRELFRPAKARFAKSFITLRSILTEKSNLMKMFTSDEWTKSQWYKEEDGKRATTIVLSDNCWRNIIYVLKLTCPIVRLLRMVDAERKPAMGYIYEAMNRCKEAISKAFNGNEKKYMRVFEIINARWNDQLHQPLHAAGHYLNPAIFYADVQGLNGCVEVMDGLLDCIHKLNLDPSIQDKIQISEMPLYRDAVSIFSKNLAIRHRTEMAPAEWWKNFGAATPNLQRFAIKVLSLTCSATGCERNWSIFQHVHSKKRNRLAQGRLNDLVFVKYNRALRQRFNITDQTDPILLSEIDESNEWLLGRMEEDECDNEDLVFEDDSLTWRTVTRASGALEPLHRREKGSSSKVARLYLVDEDDEDEDDEDEDINLIGSDEDINLIESDEGEHDKLLSENDEIDNI